MNEQDLTKILTVLKATYNHRFDVNTATQSAWRTLVSDLAYDDVNAAVTEWMMRGEAWPPVPTEVRKRVLELQSGLPSPDLAYQMVLAWMKKNYPGLPAPDTWDAPDTVQLALKDIGGLYMFRQMEADAGRKAFTSAYRTRIDRTRMQDAALTPGMKELT